MIPKCRHCEEPAARYLLERTDRPVCTFCRKKLNLLRTNLLHGRRSPYTSRYPNMPGSPSK